MSVAQPAWVLSRQSYGDSGMLVEFFSAELGRCSAVVRGAHRRKRGGSLASLLQPFHPLLITLAGRSELKSLRSAEAPRPGYHLRGDALMSGLYLNELAAFVATQAPAGPHLFPEDQITDRSQRFLAAELVREKIVRQLGDELPYSTAVEIEAFKQDERGILHIHALILVEREGQKKILVGESGGRLKSIGTSARRDMERAFDGKVMLKLWVKVKSGWSDDIRALKTLGLDPQGDQ